MIATCPNDKSHDEFVATVTTKVIVTSCGAFLGVPGKHMFYTDKTCDTYEPDDTWVCATCGAQAKLLP